MKIGYARGSGLEENSDIQMEALRRSGCERIFQDTDALGHPAERPGLVSAIQTMQKGDIFVIWRLDRLGKSLSRLIEFIDDLGQRGIDFCSLCEAIDTSSPGGQNVFHVMTVLAEFQRSLVSERTRAGMQLARDRGQRLGRPRSLTPDQVDQAILAVEMNGEYVSQVARRLEVSRRSLRRLMRMRHSQHKG